MADEIEFSPYDGQAANHVWTDDERPCWDCGEPTKWVELAFEAPLHPGECTDRKYRELEEADRAAAAEADRRRDEAARAFETNPRPGDRKVENGVTMQWTGAFWRQVPRSELETEKRRQR